MTEPQKFYLGYLDKEVIIVSRFTHKKHDNEQEYVVVSDGDWFHVTSEVNLKPIEETRWYKRKKQLESQIQDLEKQKEAKIKEIKNKALKKIVMNMKLNSVFADAKDKKLTQIGLAIAEKLEEMIEDIKLDS